MPLGSDPEKLVRILFVTPQIAWPLSNGGEIRDWNVLQGLLQAGDTDALVFAADDYRDAPQAFSGCRKIILANRRHVVPGPKHQRRYQSWWGRALLVLGSTLPFEWLGDARRALRNDLKEQCDFGNYDLVWYATAEASFALGRIDVPVQILDGDDFLYVREWLLLRSSPPYGSKIWNYVNVAKLWYWERRFPSRFTAVVRCSEQDRKRQPARNVEVVPNGTIVPLSIKSTPQCRILFVGLLGYPPNRQGMEWFLGLVWPTIRYHIPEVRLDIVGREPGAAIEAHDGKNGVVVHGYVEDLETLYRGAALSVVPLHAAGGTRLKILESLARAVPVVSTSIGAFGIAAESEHGLVRADQPQAFAERCIELLSDSDTWQSRAMAGRELAKSIYDWRIIRTQVARLASRYVAQGKPPESSVLAP